MLKVRADTSVLPPGDGAYRAEIHFHTHEAFLPQPCFIVALHVDTLNFKMSQPDPEKGISKAVMKLTDDPDDPELKIKIVQENPPASQIVTLHLFSTDPFTGKPLLLFGTQWQLGQMTQLPPGDPIPGPGDGCQAP